MAHSLKQTGHMLQSALKTTPRQKSMTYLILKTSSLEKDRHVDRFQIMFQFQVLSIVFIVA